MAKIERRISTKNAINTKQYPAGRNATVSFSKIGEPCSRKLWYEFHWVARGEPFDARRQRIFSVGRIFERIAIQELKSVGVSVFKINEQGLVEELFGTDGEKQEVLLGKTGHSKGKPDGRCIGVHEAPKTEHLLELKTMKQEEWKKVLKSNIKESKPEYYDQVQRLMREMKLKRCLFISINKNTCEYIFERIELDESHAASLERKELHIITSDAPPEKFYDQGHWKCEPDQCSNALVCRNGDEPEKNCRTCDFSDMENGGKWSCQKQDGKVLSYDEQLAGCDQYKKGWNL
jgi:hypothetical protein